MNRLYVDTMDGLRGLAVLLVLFSHIDLLGFRLFPWIDFAGVGKAGVYLFFVLSAWLLTSRALAARNHNGWPRNYWLGYWARRCFRILPLYSLVLLFCVITTGADWPIWVIQMSPQEAVRHLAMLEGKNIFWAIPVEFIFYLLLPLVLTAALWLRARASLFTPLFLLSLMVLPVLLPPGGVYSANTTNLWAYWPIFMAGMGLAFAASGPGVDRVKRCFYGKTLPLALAFGAAVLFSIPDLANKLVGWLNLDVSIERKTFHSWIIPYGLIWVGLLACVLFEARPLLARIFGCKLLVATGRISFSIYLLHIPVIRALKLTPLDNEWVLGWSSLIISVALATISFYTIEQPGIKTGRKLAKRLTR